MARRGAAAGELVGRWLGRPVSSGPELGGVGGAFRATSRRRQGTSSGQRVIGPLSSGASTRSQAARPVWPPGLSLSGRPVTPTAAPAVQPTEAEAPTEWPVNDPPSRVAPSGEPAGAQRDVLLWQRWVRYVAVLLMGCATLVLRASMPTAGTWQPLAALAFGYGSVTAIMVWFLQYASAETMPPRLPALVMALDLVAAAGTVYLTAPARDYDRLLVLGLVVAQVAMVYYGLSYALWGLAATGIAYVVGSLVLRPLVPGPPTLPLTVAVDAATFGFAAAALLYTFGTFRTRMNALRRFCRDVEVGELGGTFDATTEPRPDDLTLLARSVDEMRQRLIRVDRHRPAHGMSEPEGDGDPTCPRLPLCTAAWYAVGGAGRRRRPLQADQ